MAPRHTRKASKHLPKHAATMKGLHGWYEHMFEKLGWMVLAKEKGYDYKIDAYKKSIGHLIASIKHVSSEYENHNRKHDLNVLLMNTECLKDFVMKHF
jgi:hypothetical protein